MEAAGNPAGHRPAKICQSFCLKAKTHQLAQMMMMMTTTTMTMVMMMMMKMSTEKYTIERHNATS